MIVLTIGTFDLFHEGHQRLLDRAARFGELHVGVNSDRFVEQYKGQPSVQRQWDRLERVAAHPSVVATYINRGPGDTLIRFVRPDLLAVGSDWHGRYLDQIQMSQAELDQLDIALLFLPRTPGVSTTDLRGAAA